MMFNKWLQGILTALGALLIVLVVLVIVVKVHDVKDITRGNIYSAKTISTVGEAKIMAKPDQVYLAYDIVAEGKDEKDTREIYLKKHQDFIDALKIMGIDRSNVTTTAFTVAKDEEAVKDKQYKATVTVQVKIEDTKAIDDMIRAMYDLAEKQELKTSPFASYPQCAGFKDYTQFFTAELRAQAIENAKKKAEDLVKSTGLMVGKIVGVNSYESPSYYSATGQCPYPVPGVPLAPVELTLSINPTFEVR